MKLYISNTTKQNAQFRYRLTKDGQVIMKDIPYGKQVCLDQDLQKEQIDFILSQHTGDTHEYMVEQKDVDLTAGHIGLVYRIGQPVTAEKTASIIDENDAILDQQAAQLRKDTVSVIAANLAKEGGEPAALESEVIEEVSNGSDKQGFAEGIEVETSARRGRPARR